MPYDDKGEYKICAFIDCGVKFYRSEPPHNKLNEFNWNKKEYCCRKHKRISKNPFIPKKGQPETK